MFIAATVLNSAHTTDSHSQAGFTPKFAEIDALELLQWHIWMGGHGLV